MPSPASAPPGEFAIEYQSSHHDDLNCRVCRERFEPEQVRETRIIGRYDASNAQWSVLTTHAHSPRCLELEEDQKQAHLLDRVLTPVDCSNANRVLASIQHDHSLLYRAYHDLQTEDVRFFAVWSHTRVSDPNDAQQMPSFWLELSMDAVERPIPRCMYTYGQFRGMFGQVCVLNVQIDQLNASNALDTVKYWSLAQERLAKIKSAEIMLWSHGVERVGETTQRLRVVMRVDILASSEVLQLMWRFNRDQDASFSFGDVMQGGDVSCDAQPVNQQHESWLQSSAAQVRIVEDAVIAVQQALLPPREKVQEIRVETARLAQYRIAHTRVFESDTYATLRYLMNVQMPNKRGEYYLVVPSERMLYLYEGALSDEHRRGVPLVLDPGMAPHREAEMQRMQLVRADLESNELVLRLDTLQLRELQLAESTRLRSKPRRSRAVASFATSSSSASTSN
jgi:hypothetical protein